MSETLRDLVELTIVVDPMFDQNCYVIRRRDTRDVLVVDPGLQHPRLLDTLDRAGLSCERILLTHGHPDHVNGVPAVKAAHGCEAASGSVTATGYETCRPPSIPWTTS